MGKIYAERVHRKRNVNGPQTYEKELKLAHNKRDAN